MLILDDLQGGKELAPEIGLAPAEARQRGQGGQQRPAAQRAPEIAFHAPYRGDGGRVHAIARRGALQLGLPARHAGLPVRHAFVVHQARHVVPNGHLELWLGIQQVYHGHIRRQVGGVGVEGRPRDARLQRRRPQL
ncbi:hypothetical protein D3C71_1467100 [compost metagenome]